MIFRRLLPCLVAALMALAPTLAAAASVSEVVTALEKGYASLRDLQASFAQRSELASVKKAQTGAGEVFIRKGSGAGAMFRFNYTKPRQEIISNGKKVWYYLPENRQVMTMDAASLFAGGGGVALSYLTGMGEVSRDFTVRFVGDGKDARGNYVLELVPKKPGQAFQKLHLTVSGRAVEEYLTQGRATVPFPIVSSVVFDQMGNRTAIEFSKVKVNRGVKASLFTFTPPPGVEVIQNPMGGVR
ncbi:LolA family protein [Geobacter grbiciae]|uniref:LolA family protein n=1 Tax=Geobacter grbiciae TaxID=155042 RepID=UPI001C036B89|nr:outer membrane lipoprotein carrier protein LolA [Geobacter grbiciae]MBT1074753.1 outer membrane lipoprotein carrier protein LolA [Geobacter grbiciae]